MWFRKGSIATIRKPDSTTHGINRLELTRFLARRHLVVPGGKNIRSSGVKEGKARDARSLLPRICKRQNRHYLTLHGRASVHKGVEQSEIVYSIGVGA
jgi:hypothetical protein